MNTKQKQSGFTLIELIVVIVILGLLAAVVMPKYIDFSGDARKAAAQAVAAGIASGISSNYATCKMNPKADDCIKYGAGDASAPTTIKPSTPCQSSGLGNFIKGVTLNSGVGGGTAKSDTKNFYINAGSGGSCTVLTGSGATATYTGTTTCDIRASGGSSSVDATLSIDCKLFNY